MLHVFNKNQILSNSCLTFKKGMLLFQLTRPQIAFCLYVRNIPLYELPNKGNYNRKCNG
jgi:hypothetical protein